jgi:protein arginine kinase activator
MQCQGCNIHEATVHEVMIVNAARVERHLCEACARKLGVGAPGPAGAALLQAMIQQTVAPHATQTPAPPAQCPKCKLSFAHFRQHGLLGCPECYKVYEQIIAPLLARAQEGGTHHAGKVPKRWAMEQFAQLRQQRAAPEGASPASAQPSPLAASIEEHQRHVAQVRKALADAIVGEQYELAAKLRDELRRLEPPTGRGGRA